jgi:hypothetical protein
MQKGGIKHRRDADICSLTQSLSVNDWVGTLQTVDANSDGKGVLKIAIAREIAVETWNNEISDGSDNTLIEPGTPLFQAASSMKPGQVVRFSGHFLSGSEGECLKEGSITLSGKLREPEFIFQFSSISSFSLDSPSAAVPLAAMPTASASASPIVLPAPSFDCRNAHSKSEHLICADAELSALDTDLHILYVKAKGVAHDKAAFIRANRSECRGEKMPALINLASSIGTPKGGVSFPTSLRTPRYRIKKALLPRLYRVLRYPLYRHNTCRGRATWSEAGQGYPHDDGLEQPARKLGSSDSGAHRTRMVTATIGTDGN